MPVATSRKFLGRLVDRSLVVRIDGTSGSRYRLLETVRAFALQKLDEAGEGDVTRRRYERYFEALARHTEPRLYGHSELFAYLGGLYGDGAPGRRPRTEAPGRDRAVGRRHADRRGGVRRQRPGHRARRWRPERPADFVPLAKRLAPGFTAVTYDRRGRGDSGDVLP